MSDRDRRWQSSEEAAADALNTYRWRPGTVAVLVEIAGIVGVYLGVRIHLGLDSSEVGPHPGGALLAGFSIAVIAIASTILGVLLCLPLIRQGR